MASSPELDLDASEHEDDMFPESNLDAPAPSTPRPTSSHMPPLAELSPPSSQSRGTGIAASNTKTPTAFDILSRSGATNGTGAGTTTTTNVQSGPTAGGQVKVHEPTGYQWVRTEDEPGYAWKNRKAQEEALKALEHIVDREKMVANRYGDLLLEQETAGQKS